MLNKNDIEKFLSSNSKDIIKNSRSHGSRIIYVYWLEQLRLCGVLDDDYNVTDKYKDMFAELPKEEGDDN